MCGVVDHATLGQESAANTTDSLMTPSAREDYAEIREAVRKLCAGFPGEYWRRLDREMAYPTAFVQALTASGYLSILIPEHFGGAGLLPSLHRINSRAPACTCVCKAAKGRATTLSRLTSCSGQAMRAAASE